MLLELYEVKRCLDNAGITAGASDNRIQPYPGRPALEVRIDDKGSVARLNLLIKGQLEAIRKFECSTGGLRESTPGFNVDPLYRIKSGVGQKAFEEFQEAVENLKKRSKAGAADASAYAIATQAVKILNKKSKSGTGSKDERRNLAENLRALCEPNWDVSDKSKISQCLAKAARTLSEELAGANDGRLAPLLELLKRSEVLPARRLHEGVADALIKAFASGEGGVPPQDCLRMLFSSRGPGSKKATSNEAFSLILELDEASETDGPANHETAWKAANDWLVARRAQNPLNPPTKGRSTSPEDRLGIFGEPIVGTLGAMPERNLPRLGKVKLFSLSDQSPCQARYGLIESEACPVGPGTQAQLVSALQWITEKEREEKTWADVSDSCGYEQPALLVAYVTNMPAVHPAATSFFVRPSAGAEGVDPGAESRFEARAKSLIEALQGMVCRDPGLSVAVMVLAKADKARKKLLYSHRFDVRSLIRAAGEWQEAARNYPPISIRSLDSHGRPFGEEPWTPYPSEVVRVINTSWDSNGENPQRVSNAQLGLVLGLLLEVGPRRMEVTRETMRLLVQATTPVVLALGRSWAAGRVFTPPKKFQDIPPLTPAIIGLVLWKSGHRKGVYMSRNPYLIGQLLSLADEFHRFYCQHERKGDLPPRLIGNALMPTALERPTEGLARLAERLLLYQSVASTELREKAGRIERAIDKESLPSHCSDEDKAQMLLGYLARPELDTPSTDEETAS